MQEDRHPQYEMVGLLGASKREEVEALGTIEEAVAEIERRVPVTSQGP